jgi:hypothetical protein
MTARVVRHRSGVVSIEPADAELEANAVELVLRVFGDSVVAIADVDIEEAKERHPSSWQRRPRPRLHPAPKGTAA